MNTDQFLNNPWTQIGLGIMANNKPGSHWSEALGRGGLMGLESMRQFEEMQRRAQGAKSQERLRSFQMEKDQEELERLRAAAEAKKKFSQAYQSAKTDEERAAIAQAAAMAEGEYGSVASMMNAGKKTNSVVDQLIGVLGGALNRQDIPGDKPTIRDQQKSAQANEAVVDTFGRVINAYENMGAFNLGAAGEARSIAGNILSEIGEGTGSDLAKGMAESINPKAAREFRESVQLLATQLTPIVTQENRFTDQERAMVKELASGEGDWTNSLQAAREKLVNMLHMVKSRGDTLAEWAAGAGIMQSGLSVSDSARFMIDRLENKAMSGSTLGPYDKEKGGFEIRNAEGTLIGYWS